MGEPATKPSEGQVWSETDLQTDPHERDDKADRVRRMFGAIADSYDLNNRVHSLGRDQAWRRRAVREARVGPDDRVLDVACGTGDLTEAFARAKPASVKGLDFTEAMLDRARAKADRTPRSLGVPQPVYTHGDAMALPFEDAAFDLVSIAFGIRNVSDPGRAIGEFHRVLGPGGRLVILEFGRPRNRLLGWFNDLYCGRIMPVTATLLARDRSGAYRYLPRSVQTFLDPTAMSDLLKSHGFTSVRTIPMTFGICLAYVAHK